MSAKDGFTKRWHDLLDHARAILYAVMDDFVPYDFFCLAADAVHFLVPYAGGCFTFRSTAAVSFSRSSVRRGE